MYAHDKSDMPTSTCQELHVMSQKEHLQCHMASGKSYKSKMTSQEQQQIKSNKSGVKCQEKQVKRDISRVKSVDQLRLVF